METEVKILVNLARFPRNTYEQREKVLHQGSIRSQTRFSADIHLRQNDFGSESNFWGM